MRARRSLPALLLAALPLTALPLAGCNDWAPTTGYLLAANGATIAIAGRTVPDMVVSAVSGKDCNVAQLDQHKPYCRDLDPPTRPSAWCTRSLGSADCWQSPQLLPPGTPFLGDTPAPTAAQVKQAASGWLARQFGW